jgi:predicted RNA-binding protein (virulence factor B family)
MFNYRLKQLSWSELPISLQEHLMKSILAIAPSRFSQSGTKLAFGDSLIGFLVETEMKWKSLSPAVQDVFFQITRTWMENVHPASYTILLRG